MDGSEDFDNIPKFGDSTSRIEDVVNFYAHWESYSTKKSYAWLFTHNINEIRDRRVLKLVDKEHKKIQQKARKERNEEVRSLVLFVKKRDKRMAEYRRIIEEKAQQNRLKSEKYRLEQMKARNDMIKEQQKNRVVKSEHEDELRLLEESYLNQYSNSEADDSEEVDEVEEGLNNVDLDESEQVFEDELYCVACNKFFNSESAKQNHEASKKHRQNMEILKSEMEAEEETYQQKLSDDVEEVDDDVENEIDDHEDEQISEKDEPEPVKKLKGKKSKKKNKKVMNYSSESDAEIEEKVEEETPVIEAKLVEPDEDDWSSGKKSKKVKSKGKSKSELIKIAEPEPKKDEVQVKQPTISESSDVDCLSSEHNCATCKATFPSKNKLFTHLKKTNHSIYLGEMKAKNVEKPMGKKKK